MAAVLNIFTGEFEEETAIQPQDVVQPVQQPVQPEGVLNIFTGEFDQPSPQLGTLEVQPIPELAAQQQQIASERPPPPPADTQTRAVRELPELATSGILSDVSKLQALRVAPAILTATNPREIADILTNSFPQIGITEDEQGNLIANNNQNGVQAVINPPGVSVIDFLQGVGIASAFTPAASIAASAPALGGKLLVGGAGARLTQQGLEGAQLAVGGSVDEGEVSLATTLGAGAELLVPSINAIRRGRRAKAEGLEVEQLSDTIPSIREADVATGKVKEITGKDVELFPAQKTLVPSSLQKQRLLPQLDAASRQSLKALEKQNKQTFDAVVKFLDVTAPAQKGAAQVNLRTVAKRAIEAQKQTRKEAANFGEAIRVSDEQGLGVVMDIAPVNKIIKSLEDETVTGGQLESTIKKVQGFLTPKGGKEFLSFKQLQRSKKEIDGLVNKIGPDAIDPSVKGELIKIKTSLVEQMKKASPPFKEASERFAKESKAVNELQESLIGRVADVTDKQLKTISSEIFNPRTSVDDVLKARKTIEKIDPSAWDGIVRNELDFRVSSITKSIEEGGINTIPNIPALLKRSIFGTGNKREVMLRSLTPEQRKNFIFLETTLSRAGQGRAAGSPTASNLEILKDLRPKLGLLKDIFLTPIKKLQETGETGLFNKAVKGLAGVMLDTKWQPRLAKLRKLDNRSPAAARAMVQLVDDAIAADTADNTPSAKE